jgi:hypothetical protein
MSLCVSRTCLLVSAEKDHDARLIFVVAVVDSVDVVVVVRHQYLLNHYHFDLSSL